MSRAKRGATTDLNHDNWDQEEDKEEAGVFKLAPPEEIERRVIKQAVRRRPVITDSNNTADEKKKNVFGCLNLKGFDVPEVKPNSVFKAFNFLGNSEDMVPKELPIVNQKNEVDDKMALNAFNSTEAKPAVKVPSFDFLGSNKNSTTDASIANQSSTTREVKTTEPGDQNPELNTDSISLHNKAFQDKDLKSLEVVAKQSANKCFNADRSVPTFSSSSSLRDFVEPTFRKYSHLISKPPVKNKKISGGDKCGRSEEFLQNMTEINESFSKWIQKNLAEDPTSILTRCFKDYIKHVQALFDEEKKGALDENQLEVLKKQEHVLNEVVILDGPRDVAVKSSEGCI